MVSEWLQTEVFHHTAGYCREATGGIWVGNQKQKSLLQIPLRAGSTGEQRVVAHRNHRNAASRPSIYRTHRIPRFLPPLYLFRLHARTELF